MPLRERENMFLVKTNTFYKYGTKIFTNLLRDIINAIFKPTKNRNFNENEFLFEVLVAQRTFVLRSLGFSF